MRSRLDKNIKKQNIKILVIIIVLLLLVGIFGMKLLIGFSVILEKFKSPNDSTITTQSVDYVAPPVINSLPDATSSATIAVSGYSLSDNVSIDLYVNGDFFDKTTPDANKNFTFNEVTLKPGDNEIEAKSVNSDNKQSDYSESENISYINKQPTLEVDFPQDGQSFKKEQSPIKISGKADPGDKVTVNGFWAISNDDGTFYYLYNLQEGDNDLKIAVTDDVGNQTTKEMHIKTSD